MYEGQHVNFCYLDTVHTKASSPEAYKDAYCTCMYIFIADSGGGSPSPSHQPWWMGADSVEPAAVSDHELEATAQSWLKSTTQSRT